MGHDTLRGSGAFRIAGVVLAASFALGLGAGTAAAGFKSEGGIAPISEKPLAQTLPSEASKTQDVIVVADKNKNKNKNKYYGRKYYNKKDVVVVRPYRRWNKRPYYGTIIGGVALGTILGAAAYSATAPAPNLCWYWADPYRTRGYWDYCY